MEYIRVKTYYPGTGKWTGCEHLYLVDSQVEALNRFRKDYQEHNKMIAVAETIDSEDAKYKEYVEVCRKCGVIN